MAPHSLFSAVVRLLPASLRQSPDNPIQLDRLPDTAGVELDYPVTQHTPATAMQVTLFSLFVAAIAPPLLGLVGFWTPRFLFQLNFSTFVLSIAAALAAACLLAPRHAYLAVAAGVAAWPIMLVALLQAPFPLVALGITLLVQLAFAQRLVANYLYLKTAAPFDKGSARELRARWQRRPSLLSAPFPGTELWTLSQVLLALTVAIVMVTPVLAPSRQFGAGFLFLVAWLALLVVVLLRRNLVAWLFRRPLPPWRSQRPALRRALIEWWTYNSSEVVAPGVHQSPVGSCRVRRGLAVALALAWAATWVAFAVNPSATLFGVHSGQDSSVAQQFAPPSIDPPAARSNTVEAASRAPGKNASPAVGSLTPAEQEFFKDAAPDDRQAFLAAKADLAAQARLRESPEPAPSTQGASAVLVGLTLLVFAAAQVLIPAVVTLLVAGTWLAAAAGPPLAGIEQICGARDRRRVLSTSGWESLVHRLRTSQDDTENTSLLLGTNARDDSPVLVPREVFQEHAHILGDSGSGKTSIGILPLVAQLMRFGDASVIVIDLKADDQLIFETMQTEATQVADQLRQSYPFRWFTTVLGRSSFIFNPLTQRVMGTLSPDQQTDVLTAGLGLQYGNDYGRKYYGDANFDLLNYALGLCRDAQSFGDIELALKKAQMVSQLPRKTLEAANHVLSSMRRLSRCLPLNACPRLCTSPTALENAIELADVFARPQALYVALPPGAGISSTAEIARLFLYSLMAAAQAHPKDTPRTQVYLVIDEFQRIVSGNVELFLQQARSMNIGCIFSNQSLADLDRIGAELVPAIRTNTRFRQVFGAGHRDDIEDIIMTSGETVYGHRAWSYLPGLVSPVVQGVSVGEHRSPRISVNDVLLATDALGRSIACLRRGAGYAQFGGMPFVMDSVFHISKQTFIERTTAPWPAADERTIVALKDSPTTPAQATVLDDDAPITRSARDDAVAPAAVVLAEEPMTSPSLPTETEEEDDSDDAPCSLVDDAYDDQLAQRERERRAERRRRRRL